jgi:hypothetical protein
VVACRFLPYRNLHTGTLVSCTHLYASCTTSCTRVSWSVVPTVSISVLMYISHSLVGDPMGCIRIYATSHRIQLLIIERAIFERAVTEVRSVVSLAHDFLHQAENGPM